MAKIVGAYQSLQSAQEALTRIVESGAEPGRLSIIGPGQSQINAKSPFNKSWLWGVALGAAIGFALPGGGHLLLAGHLARAAVMHALGVTAKGIIAGATAGGTVDLLRRLGLDRRSAVESAEVVAQGKYALALDGNWVTVERARIALGGYQQRSDPYLFEMVRRYGYEYQSFLSLYGGMERWTSSDPEAAVVYRRVGRVAVVAAAPLAARENLAEITRSFLVFCAEQKLDCLMLPIGAEYAAIARSCGMALLHIGESGYFKLPEWRPAGDRAKKVRAGVNQATKAGVRVEPYDSLQCRDPRARAEIEDLCQAWINTREVEAFGWLLELNPFHLCESKRYFLARHADGKLEGMLVCSPIYARNGWYLEDLIRRPGAERGVSELLTVEALKRLAAEGARLATLGTSPLAGIEPQGQFKQISRLLKLIYEHLDAFYHFKALHRFKAKFAPSFVDQEYVAIFPPRIRLRMALAVIGAFDPAGLTGVMASKLRRIWREARSQSD
jgi:Phosphatidylglycerol lysyltransferase, C-terminal